MWENYTANTLREPILQKLRPARVSSLALAKELYYKSKAKLVEEEVRLRQNQDRREKEIHLKKLHLHSWTWN